MAEIVTTLSEELNFLFTAEAKDKRVLMELSKINYCDLSLKDVVFVSKMNLPDKGCAVSVLCFVEKLLRGMGFDKIDAITAILLKLSSRLHEFDMDPLANRVIPNEGNIEVSIVGVLYANLVTVGDTVWSTMEKDNKILLIKEFFTILSPDSFVAFHQSIAHFQEVVDTPCNRGWGCLFPSKLIHVLPEKNIKSTSVTVLEMLPLLHLLHSVRYSDDCN